MDGQLDKVTSESDIQYNVYIMYTTVYCILLHVGVVCSDHVLSCIWMPLLYEYLGTELQGPDGSSFILQLCLVLVPYRGNFVGCKVWQINYKNTFGDIKLW